MRPTAALALILGILLPVPRRAAPEGATALAAQEASPRTRLVVLGTGTPNADPERWGPAVAVVVDSVAYLVDAGPGVVRRAAGAARRHGLEALRPARLGRVFLTHLHSDHTLGLPDLMLSPWVLDRPAPLGVWGPPGTEAMAEAIGEAWTEDIRMRVYGREPRAHNAEAWEARVAEFRRGRPVYEDRRVRVEAVPVDHGTWPHAFGYRFTGPDRRIVISGDTRPTEAIVRACDGCDVLVHEVYSAERFRAREPEWRRYHASYHTSTEELADLASRARPGLLVLYHQLFWGADDEDLIREIREAGYRGPVVSGEDLEVY